MVDLAREFWECEEIQGRASRILTNNEQYDSGTIWQLGRISMVCVGENLNNVFFYTVFVAIGCLITPPLLYIAGKYLKRYIDRQVTNSCLGFIQQFSAQALP